MKQIFKKTLSDLHISPGYVIISKFLGSKISSSNRNSIEAKINEGHYF